MPEAWIIRELYEIHSSPLPNTHLFYSIFLYYLLNLLEICLNFINSYLKYNEIHLNYL